MHFSDYEADQSRLYNAHPHDKNSPESKAKVSKIWRITLYLSIITIIEVALGLYGHYNGMSGMWIKLLFIIGTLWKASLIVSVFMHLGDEIKSMIMTILIPLTLFIWFIIAFLADGAFWLYINEHIYHFS